MATMPGGIFDDGTLSDQDQEQIDDMLNAFGLDESDFTELTRSETLPGGDDNVAPTGSAPASTVDGGGNDDSLIGGAGKDSVFGGKGDLDGQAVWLRILRAIEQLLSTDPKTVH